MYSAQKRWCSVIVGIIRHIAVTCSLGHNQIFNYTWHLPHGPWLSPSLFKTSYYPIRLYLRGGRSHHHLHFELAGWRFQTLPRFFVVAWCPSSCATMQHSAACGLIYLQYTPGEFRIPLVTLRGHFYCFATGWSSPFVDVTALVCWWGGTPDNHGRTNVNISYLQRLNSVKKKKILTKKIYGKTHVKNNFSYFLVTTNKILSLQFRLYNRYHKLA